MFGPLKDFTVQGTFTQLQNKMSLLTETEKYYGLQCGKCGGGNCSVILVPPIQIVNRVFNSLRKFVTLGKVFVISAHLSPKNVQIGTSRTVRCDSPSIKNAGIISTVVNDQFSTMLDELCE